MSAKTDEFLKIMVPLVRNEYLRRDKWVLPSVALAMGAKESGWCADTSKYSLYGIKGAGTIANTKEYIDGAYVDVSDSFRTYPDTASAVVDYFDLITTSPRYAGAVNNPDYRSAVTAIRMGGYATAPAKEYINSVCSIIEDFNLTQYDVREYTKQQEQETIDIESLALQTIRGDFGNGQDRINNFHSMGYTDNIIDLIQHRVNEIMASYDTKPQEEYIKKEENSACIQNANHVKIKAGAVDLNSNTSFADFVYNSVYEVIEYQDRGLVFGLNGCVTGVVSYDNIIIVD